MDKELKERQNSISWNCRWHPIDWWHEIGCPHQEWTNEQLLSALITKKESEKIREEYIKKLIFPSLEELKL